MDQTTWCVMGAMVLRRLRSVLLYLIRMACAVLAVVEVGSFVPDSALLTWGALLMLCTAWGTMALMYWLIPSPGEW